MVELEGSIDFEKAEKEIETVTQDLKGVLSKDKLTRFVTNTVQFRMKKMKRAEYYGYLQTQIESLSNGQDPASEIATQKKYENVLNYLRYSQLYDSIDVGLFDEIESLEKTIKDKLLKP